MRRPSGVIAPVVSSMAPKSASSVSARSSARASGASSQRNVLTSLDAARLEREDHLGKIEPFHFGKFLGERARSAHARSIGASNGPARCGRRDRRADRRRRG